MTFCLLALCVGTALGQVPAKHTSGVSVKVRAFIAGDSLAIGNFVVALYDTSGVKIDSLLSPDTNAVTFSNVSTTGVDASSGLPAGYSLEQNYPNPFNPTSIIRFTVPSAGPVSLTTYNILGQKDAMLEMMLEPGNHEVEYQPGGGAGVLFYTLRTKDFSATKKMTQFGGEKSGRSKLRLLSSSAESRTMAVGKVGSTQASHLIIKLYSLTATYPQFADSSFLIAGLGQDTTLNFYMNGAPPKPCAGTGGTVQIGPQCWMPSNMVVAHMILDTAEATNNGIAEQYCYGDTALNCDKYGGLFQWEEAMDYSKTQGAQGICPNGWHIPSEYDFDVLIATVRGDGNALKATGEGSAPDGGAGTNTSGFAGLLAGTRYKNGWASPGQTGTFWSSTYNESGGTAGALVLDFEFASADIIYSVIKLGFSVRCLKN